MELKALAETEQATLKRYQDAQARIRLTEDKCKYGVEDIFKIREKCCFPLFPLMLEYSISESSISDL